MPTSVSLPASNSTGLLAGPSRFYLDALYKGNSKYLSLKNQLEIIEVGRRSPIVERELCSRAVRFHSNS